MANTKKTTENKDVKSAINTETGADEVQENIVETAAETESEKKSDMAEVINSVNKSIDDVSNVKEDKKVSRRAEIPHNEEIPVKSATKGGLSWVNPVTNAYYFWNDIGYTEYMPFGDLITLNNNKPVFLREPLVVLDDPRVIDYFRLGGLYEKVSIVNSLQELFEEGNMVKIEQALRDIRNTNMRNVAMSKIKELRESKLLTNIDIIRLIERILCFDVL